MQSHIIHRPHDDQSSIHEEWHNTEAPATCLIVTTFAIKGQVLMPSRVERLLGKTAYATLGHVTTAHPVSMQ